MQVVTMRKMKSKRETLVYSKSVHPRYGIKAVRLVINKEQA